MGRPLYETEQDRQNAREVIPKLAHLFRLDWFELPPKYPLDFALTDKTGRVRALVDVKCRTCGSRDFKTYFVELDKLVNGIAYARAAQVPVYLLVKWSDGVIGYIGASGYEELDVRKGGRADRGDPEDNRPVAHFKISAFNEIRSNGTMGDKVQ